MQKIALMGFGLGIDDTVPGPEWFIFFLMASALPPQTELVRSAPIVFYARDVSLEFTHKSSLEHAVSTLLYKIF